VEPRKEERKKENYLNGSTLHETQIEVQIFSKNLQPLCTDNNKG
jgi:hypothetical protein